MPTLSAKNAALLTKPETALVLASSKAAARALGASALKSKLAQARKLREKYTTLVKRQRESLPKVQREGANQRTATKLDLITGALQRFDRFSQESGEKL